MTKTILSFPVRFATSLYCVWFETGDPARPLACTWIASEIEDSESAFTAKPGVCWLCA